MLRFRVLKKLGLGRLDVRTCPTILGLSIDTVLRYSAWSTARNRAKALEATCRPFSGTSNKLGLARILNAREYA